MIVSGSSLEQEVTKENWSQAGTGHVPRISGRSIKSAKSAHSDLFIPIGRGSDYSAVTA
jgi:hypothetical protein